MSTRFVRFLVEDVRARNGDRSKVGDCGFHGVLAVYLQPDRHGLCFQFHWKALRVCTRSATSRSYKSNICGCSHSNIDGYGPLVTAVLPLLFRSARCLKMIPALPKRFREVEVFPLRIL